MSVRSCANKVPAYADFLRSTVTTPTSCMIRLCEGIITFPRNTGTISQSQVNRKLIMVDILDVVKAKNVVQRLLTVDPKKRMTASECLDHPWITVGFFQLRSCTVFNFCFREKLLQTRLFRTLYRPSRPSMQNES